MNQTNISETLQKADDYYQKAIDLDTKKNIKDALVLYDSARQVYESVYKYKPNDIESATLNQVESNIKNIYNRIAELNINLQKRQQQQNPVQIMYPQIPVPPASYAGVQNYPQNANYLPQGPLYNQLPSLSEIGNMNAGGSPSASPQTSYPQFNPVQMPQEANSSQQQYYYQQGQVPNQIQQQQQNQIPAQLYQQPQSQQNIQQPQFQNPSGDQHQSSPQSNPPLPTSSEDNRHQKVEKKKFHWGKKKKDDDTDNDKDSTKKKKHDKKHDEKEKNKQLHDQDQQKQALSQHPQQNPIQYPNQQQPNWQQVPQVNPQANQLVQNQMQPQFAQPQQLMQSQMVQQQMLQQPQQPIQPQSQLYQQPPQSYQPPQQYQIQYPQPQQFQVQQQFSQPQSPSREIAVDPALRNNNIQSHHNNSDSQSYDSGYDYDQDKTTGSTHRRTHHVLMSDQIIQPKDYTVKRVLGKGANGMVYLVSDVHTKKEYAMKELLHQLISSEEQKSFFREIELMIHANHPAVLKLVGFSMTNSENKNSPILILELMPNGSLQDVIEKKKSFTLTQKYIALYGIAEAMKYLHSKDIVHRDLKPANVLLNQYDEPAVADFGLSKLMSQELMRQTQAAGSPVYMAPELMMRQDYNNSIDVYAYGYICYELLLEELSFNNVNNVYDLVNMVCNGSRPPLNGKNLDDKWKLLISNCWDANPYERPTFHEICQFFIERSLPFNNIDMNRFAQYEAKIKTKK